ncbi:ABC transporter permease [Microbacterium sp. R86528]|uniref:ABC transporter permease n=1 Tax=Microbacterium sp. R86528 TaxID=3093864 RepID=UPI0037C6E80D
MLRGEPAFETDHEPSRAPLPRNRAEAALWRRPTFTLSVLIVSGWVIAALGWRWLGLDPFGDTGAKLEAPSTEHWMGTDRLGRDVLARVLAGSESALIVAPLGALLATAFGTTLGLIAGFYRGWVDQLLMRSFDIVLAIPSIIFFLVLVAAFGGSTIVVALSVGFLFAPSIARVIRAEVLVEMGKDYITSAKLQGERAIRMLRSELLPNVWPQVLVQATLSLAAAVFIAASLSFLGLTVSPPSPDWGLAVNENRAYLRTAWWTVVFPTAAIASFVVSVNLIGDNLKEVFRR